MSQFHSNSSLKLIVFFVFVDHKTSSKLAAQTFSVSRVLFLQATLETCCQTKNYLSSGLL